MINKSVHLHFLVSAHLNLCKIYVVLFDLGCRKSNYVSVVILSNLAPAGFEDVISGSACIL